MILAHGTSLAVAKRALRHGLMPRGRRKSRWSAFPSIKGHVYLTNAYALYYAMNATSQGDMGIVLVDTQKPNVLNMVADEDAIAQGLMLSEKMLLADAQKVAIANIWAYKVEGHDHEWSLNVLGNCAHAGPIPREAIIGAIECNGKAPWVRYFDPMISFLNYRIMGSYYRQQQSIICRLPETEELESMVRSVSEAEREFIKQNSRRLSLATV